MKQGAWATFFSICVLAACVTDKESPRVGGTGAKAGFDLESRDPNTLPYFQAMKAAIMAKWQVPSAAQGLGGSVRLAITLSSSGALERVAVESSSGHARLLGVIDAIYADGLVVVHDLRESAEWLATVYATPPVASREAFAMGAVPGFRRP